MKMQDAMKMIDESENKSGYMVSFEWIENGFLKSDHFPDKHAGEPLIPTEEEAWSLAKKFADATKGKTCNIYVIGSDFGPVKGYESKEIKNR